MGGFDLEQLRSHDEQAWAAFARFFEGRLYHFTMRYSSRISEEMAADIVQETILAAYEEICVRAGSLREEGKYLTTWVYGICKNRCRDVLKALHTCVEKGEILKLEQTQATRDYTMLAESEEVRKLAGMEDCLDCLPGEELKELAVDCLCLYPFDTLDILVECFQRFRPRLRAVFLLRYIVGLKYQEIAEALDISLEAVKGRLHEGTPELRQRLRRRSEKVARI
ncbi:MAG: RNA polymerase sigma factor [Gemmatimonadetes bacterium]|jgi:RNA polymerase sigma factor (sigma-70 family)|nr:RNA polymerase sigma factor [Gemmatimonadota bacterium]